MNSGKVALITGITGQDGSYLAEFLLDRGYQVHGVTRRASIRNTGRIDHLITEATSGVAVTLHAGDLSDGPGLTRLIREIAPDEIYNLGAQSDVRVSFEAPEYTADINGLGTLRLLEAIRLLGLEKKTRFYQASTSELFGLARETPQKETTPFYPRSPYAVAKLFAHSTVINYREAYGIYACNGILFNHESPRRGEGFATRKITLGLSSIALGLQRCLYMGKLDALRDWGHARDYVRMQWLMLQQDVAEDFVIATGTQHSVREFIGWAAADLGIAMEFSGSGVDEVGIVAAIDGDRTPHLCVGDVILRIDPRHFRPTEADALLGDPSKAREKLGWIPQVSARDMCREMVEADYRAARRHAAASSPAYETAPAAFHGSNQPSPALVPAIGLYSAPIQPE